VGFSVKIVQIAKNIIPVPPIGYGGTERDIHYLTNCLIDRGHEVIIFAKQGSKCKGKLIPYPKNSSKNLLPFVKKNLPDGVDVIIDHAGFVATAKLPIPTLCSIHSAIKFNVQFPIYVSKYLLEHKGNGKGYFIHNGIGVEDYPYLEQKENYLLSLGRIIPSKGTHLAIMAAKATGNSLIIAGNVPKKGISYFNKKVKPHIDGEQINYIGEVGGERKMELLSKAKCVLFPITWGEPFGLVPIEAMACGTPVIAFRKGGVLETMSGFPELTCNNLNGMVTILQRSNFPPPQKLRDYVTQYFSAEVMTDNFEKLIHKAIKEYKT
jgi:glycosyltransferase involved in cell wall biosynthesis